MALPIFQCINKYHVICIPLHSLQGQCVGIEAVQMLVNITSSQTMYDYVFSHIILAPLQDKYSMVIFNNL